ncbi:MAG: ABC transporter substrate-binding protein [Polyangiales bacterium]
MRAQVAPLVLALATLIGGIFVAGCRRSGETLGASGKPRLVFAHQPMWGDPAPLRALLDDFARSHPDVELVEQILPSGSEVLHQHLLTTLDAGGDTLDVFVADIVWIPELARAGFVDDLSDVAPEEALRRDDLPGVVDAVTVGGKTFAMPWYVDVGILYYRTDLVPRAPRTWDELVSMAQDAQRRDPTLRGYLFQGRQYEGLVCNALEMVWGFGGNDLHDGRVLIDTKESRAALSFMRTLVTSGVSPPSVTSAAEEDARRVFQDGRAVFMRNWPYAWAEAQRPGSKIAGRVGFSALPTTSGQPGAGTLGGWQLAVRAGLSPSKRALARELVLQLSSHDASVMLAVEYARLPARRAVYDDPRVQQGAPFISALLPIALAARPRPPTPYYVMISDVLQSELSAIVSGIRSPEEALPRAQALIDHVTGVTP